MHHWSTVHDSAVAPSPIVPTYRPDPPSKRKYSSMPSPTSEVADATQPGGESVPRPQARSAGMAERPTRNENLSDLVRFFQTQNMPADTTTALPAVEAKEQSPNKEQLKPLHRRLFQFTQRQKKDPSSASKSKADDRQRQIEALQREGYLLSNPRPASSSRSTRSKGSIDRSFSKSKKQDVETIGQPWLEKENRGASPKLPGKGRLASLDLGDFGSMVDVAVSLSSDFDELSPPPYQPPASTASRTDPTITSQSMSALPLPSSSTESRQSSDRPTSPPASTAESQGSGSRENDSHRSSSSNDSSLRIVDKDTTPTQQSKHQPASVHTVESSDSSAKSEPKQDHHTDQPADTRNRSSSNPTVTPTQASLKLFPDVAPPRISSRNAWRLSAVPRYQTAASAPSSAKPGAQVETSDTVKTTNQKEQLSDKPTSNASKDEAESSCSRGLVATAVSTNSATAEITSSQAATQPQSKSRPPSLAMGTLKAFPLPAPTRPLPSIPKTGRAPSAPPDAKSQPTIRMVRSGPKLQDLQLSQPSPIAEDPREPELRPATALGYAGEGEAAADRESLQSRTSLERPKSTEPEQHTPRRRASSIRVPRMHDLHESPKESCEGQTPEGQPLADSPVLGQMTPTKPHGKRATRKGLHINPRIDRKNLPFGLPSPPPTAALPSDPPQPPTERPAGHRNYSIPTGAALPSARSSDVAFGQGPQRGSMFSRSNSSRSSIRHESIREYEPSRCESPLPSSDDEGFGPGADTKHSRRTAEKRSKRTHPLHRSYEALDARSSCGRLRYPPPVRPLTPQGRSSHSLDKAASPQSQYSQSTYRSRDSQSSFRAQPGNSRAANLLEDRVANLERQNQILQAALLAALNAGVKNNMGDLQDSAMPPNFPAAGLANPYQSHYASRPESWVSSSRSSEHSGLETPNSFRDSRANVRQLDNMIEGIESGWLSDKSSLSGARMTSR